MASFEDNLFQQPSPSRNPDASFEDNLFQQPSPSRNPDASFEDNLFQQPSPSRNPDSPPCTQTEPKKKKKKSELKKAKSRAKEHARNCDINEAFDKLHQVLPILMNQKLPKIKMLRLAQKYINHLEGVLRGDMVRQIPFSTSRPLQMSDFMMIAQDEIMTKNSYSKRIAEEGFNSTERGNRNNRDEAFGSKRDDTVTVLENERAAPLTSLPAVNETFSWLHSSFDPPLQSIQASFTFPQPHQQDCSSTIL